MTPVIHLTPAQRQQRRDKLRTQDALKLYGNPRRPCPFWCYDAVERRMRPCVLGARHLGDCLAPGPSAA